METPNSKLQTPGKLQTPSLKRDRTKLQGWIGALGTARPTFTGFGRDALASAAAIVLLLLTSGPATATVALDSGRFRDWKDAGCRQTPSAAGSPASGAAAGGSNQAGCTNCTPDHGIPRWSVNEPYINLHINDTPLSYMTSFGQEMTFRMFYKQRYMLPQVDECPDFYTLGNGVALRAQDHPYVQYMRSYNAGNFTNASWSHNWMMNITFWDSYWEAISTPSIRASTPIFSHGYEALVFRPEGSIFYMSDSNTRDPVSKVQLQPLSSLGYPVASNTPSTDANGIYWGDPGIGFKMVYPDGSQDIFGLAEYNSGVPNPNSFAPDTTADALLTQRIDPQGRITRIGYEKVLFTNAWNTMQFYSTHRVRYVVDVDGRTNTFIYNTNSPAHAWQLSEIDDAYGRKASLTYESSIDGRLSSITDAGGNSNYFGYTRFSGWITNLTTPYGTTAFGFYQLPDPAVTNGFLRRATCVSEPEGASQFFYYAHTNQFVAATNIPPVAPGQTFDCGTNGGSYGTLDFRNSFHWDRRQYAALSSPVRTNLPANLSSAIGYLTSADCTKAGLKHWLFGGDDETITETISSERDPSPDAAGQTVGSRTWYAYPGKPSPEKEGEALIGCIARVLPDGASQYGIYNYHPFFPALVTESEQSYSLTDGSVGRVTNKFLYANNGIDLLSASNSVGQFLKFAYNSVHQPTFITNALSQVTQLTYDSTSHKLTGLTNVSGLRTTFTYNGPNANDPNGGFLQNITVLGIGRSLSFTYTNGQPRTVQDDLGLGLTLGWDNLNRLTSISFPDTSAISNVYDRLDLVATKDRLGNWTRLGFDGLQHLKAITNALQNVTQLSWCDCGALAGITDALTNTTSLFYNNQELLTNISFPDGSSLTYAYDNAQRVISAADGLNRAVTFGYNNQGLVTTISNAIGQVERVLYDAVDRPIQVTDANGVSHTNAFDLLDRILTRSWAGDGTERFGYSTNGLIAYTNQDNQVTRFLRDVAGRATTITNANLEIVQLGYNSISEITKLIDGLNHTNLWHFNEYGLLTNKVDGLNREVFRFAYDANQRLTNRWTPEFGNAAYSFDAIGNLLGIQYPAFSIGFLYDAVNRLTNMVDQVGTTKFTWTQIGQLASEDGPWSNAKVSHGYTQRQRASLSINSQPSTINFSYGYDSAWRMSGLTSPAGSFGYQYPASGVQYSVSGITLPNGASITNHHDSLARLDYTALINRWGHVLDGYSYTHDPLGLRTNIVRDFGFTTNTVSVGYDNIGQITSWSAREDGAGSLRLNEQLAWAYDAAHNLHFRTNGGLAQTFVTDGANELTNIFRIGSLTLSGATPAPATNVTVNGLTAERYGDFSFARTNLTLADGNNTFTNIAGNTNGAVITNIATYSLPATNSLAFDSNGNLTNDGSRSFFYDAENQLTNITVPGAWKSEFVYDGLGRRRIERDYSWSSQTNETRFVYDGLLPIQERDSTNGIQVTYTRGLDLSASISGAGGIGGLLARTDAGGNSAFYHADGAGNITALVNGLGDLTARYLYGPFGRMTAQWGPMADANVMQFSSMPKHARSGLSLYPFRAYEPNLQRWITRDPIGELGGLNLYRSVRNSPVDTVDPFGLWEQMGLEPGPNAAADVRDAGNRIANLLGALLAKLNAELDRETQEDAQRIASFLGQGDNADTVDGIKHALDLMVVAGFPEGGEAGELGQLGKLGKIKKPCPTKFPVLGWRGSKPYRDALKKIQQGGPKVDLGFIPTKQEAEMLLEDAKATDLRPEDPHASPNPHDYPHINYTTPSGSKGTIPIR